MTTECPVCSETFEKKRPTHRYCSQPCRLSAMARRNRSDPSAQSERGKKGGRVRAAQMELSPGSYQKRDGRHVHRTVAEEILGRPLDPGEVVHHEDQDKHNNRPENLIVFSSQAEHARHHKLNHPGNVDTCRCDGIRLEGSHA